MDNKEQPKMRKNNALKYIVKLGDVFGLFTVKEILYQQHPNKSYYVTKYRCVNIYGKEIITSGSYLYTIKKRFSSIPKHEIQIGLRNYLYNRMKKNAQLRKHLVKLTFQEFENIIYNDCFYCGEKPQEATVDMVKYRGNMSQPNISYNGIDRIDPIGDYTIENSVACCTKCNYMKHVLTQDEFFLRIKKIYEFHNLENK